MVPWRGLRVCVGTDVCVSKFVMGVKAECWLSRVRFGLEVRVAGTEVGGPRLDCEDLA